MNNTKQIVTECTGRMIMINVREQTTSNSQCETLMTETLTSINIDYRIIGCKNISVMNIL